MSRRARALAAALLVLSALLAGASLFVAGGGSAPAYSFVAASAPAYTTVSETRRVTLSRRVVTIEDATLASGRRVAVNEGADGEMELTYTAVYRDGALVSRRETGRRVIKAPVDAVVCIGTYHDEIYSDSLAAHRLQPRPANAGEATLLRVCAFSRQKTASGLLCRVGTAAADTDVYPLGTRLYIEGYGYAVVDDELRGGGIAVYVPQEERGEFGDKLREVRVITRS